MSKKEYSKPCSEALDLASRESLMQSSLLPMVADFDTQQIEDIEVINYEW